MTEAKPGTAEYWRERWESHNKHSDALTAHLTAAMDRLASVRTLAKEAPVVHSEGGMRHRAVDVADLNKVLDSTPYAISALALTTEPEVLIQTLVAERKARGITQQQVGEVLGVGQSTIGGFEASTDPRLSTLQRYVSALYVLSSPAYNPEETAPDEF